ncbi:MAG: hypothetical protein NT076_02925, partial [Candidatus Pacearchaeota archaeon]|nr:hypothetical protein [Candidatus Pacearchaeota archaeon]
MKKLLYGLLSLLVTGCSINPANLPRENPQKITNTLESPAHGPFYMEEQTPATAFFDSFPDKIQGIRAIRKYRTPGARRCLVHVLDNHFFWKKDYWDIKNLENAEEEKLHFKILREKYDLVNAVQ